MSFEDGLLVEARAMLADLAQDLEDIRALNAEVLTTAAAELEEDAARDEERARRARRGELGPDWRRLQERIDRGETSLGAIAQGLDDSWEAQEVRTHTIDNLAASADGWRLPDPDADEPEIDIAHSSRPSPADLPAQARAAMAAVAATTARLQAAQQRLRELPVPDPG